MVLAKLPDAPAGVKGISLFIVPKFLVNDDGSSGPAQRRRCWPACSTRWAGAAPRPTALNFGDNGECVGYLVGKPHQGLSYMFQMMNEARIGVGMGAVMLGYAGYLSSLEYARERPQGRRAGQQEPDHPHRWRSSSTPTCGRMLLTQKAYVERAFDPRPVRGAPVRRHHDTGDRSRAQAGRMSCWTC